MHKLKRYRYYPCNPNQLNKDLEQEVKNLNKCLAYKMMHTQENIYIHKHTPYKNWSLGLIYWFPSIWEAVFDKKHFFEKRISRIIK